MKSFNQEIGKIKEARRKLQVQPKPYLEDNGDDEPVYVTQTYINAIVELKRLCHNQELKDVLNRVMSVLARAMNHKSRYFNLNKEFVRYIHQQCLLAVLYDGRHNLPSNGNSVKPNRALVSNYLAEMEDCLLEIEQGLAEAKILSKSSRKNNINISVYSKYTYQLTFFVHHYQESCVQKYESVITFKSRKQARDGIKRFRREISSRFSYTDEIEVKDVSSLPYREDFALAMEEMGYSPIHKNIETAIEQIQKKIDFKPIESKDRPRQDCQKLIGKSVLISAKKTNRRDRKRFLYKDVTVDYLEEVNGIYHNFHLKVDHIWAVENFNFSSELGNNRIAFVATSQEYTRQDGSKSVGFIKAENETKEYINELLISSILFFSGGIIRSQSNIASQFLFYLYHVISEEVREAFEIGKSTTEDQKICIHFQKLLNFVEEIYSLAVMCVANLQPGNVYIALEEFIQTGEILPGMRFPS
ncbi:MAG: hypothetical protein AAGA80_06715 [Cyanobacteria bacterium P01_F01_bin.143]